MDGTGKGMRVARELGPALPPTMPPLTAGVAAALLGVYASASKAAPGLRSIAAEASAVAVAAAEQQLPLDGAACEALVLCWEAGGAGAGLHMASSTAGSQQAPAAPLCPLLEQLFGVKALEAVEEAAFAEAAMAQPVLLPSPSCSIEQATAAMAAEMARAAGWEPVGAGAEEALDQQQEPEDQPAEEGARQEMQGPQLRAALRKGDLSPAVLVACHAIGEVQLLVLLEELAIRQQVGLTSGAVR